MNLDHELAIAHARVQAVIDARYAEAMARIKFSFEHARRSLGQRIRFAKHVPKELQPEEAGARIRRTS